MAAWLPSSDSSSIIRTPRCCSLEGLPVVLTSGRTTLAETTTNQFGEFMFEMDSERENHLAIAVGDEFALVVPLGRRRGHA